MRLKRLEAHVLRDPFADAVRGRPDPGADERAKQRWAAVDPVGQAIAERRPSPIPRHPVADALRRRPDEAPPISGDEPFGDEVRRKRAPLVRPKSVQVR